MIPKKEIEKLILFCLEELRLLIEKPYENYALALVERLSTVRNKIEMLYHQILLERR